MLACSVIGTAIIPYARMDPYVRLADEPTNSVNRIPDAIKLFFLFPLIRERKCIMSSYLFHWYELFITVNVKQINTINGRKQ
jgi:hypothetical protein